MKNIIHIVCFAFLMVGCSDEETLENCNLEDYFYDPKDFSDAKIHVFRKDSMGHQSEYYLKIEKITSNKIQITQYSDKLVMQGRLKDEFKEDGVDLVLSEFNVGNGEMVEGFIQSGRIYSFDKKTSECEFAVNYSGENPQRFLMRDKSKLKRSELTRKIIQGESLNTIVSKGFLERYEEYSSYFAKIPLTVWYTKGIGVTLIKEDYLDGVIKCEYMKSITKSEFESLIEEYN